MCVNGPPEKQNLKDEADTFMHVIAAHYVSITDFSIFFSVILFYFFVSYTLPIFANLLSTMNICLVLVENSEFYLFSPFFAKLLATMNICISTYGEL